MSTLFFVKGSTTANCNLHMGLSNGGFEPTPTNLAYCTNGWTTTRDQGNRCTMSVNLSHLEDCERVRPNWSPEDGVASSFAEFFATMNEPLGFVWLALLALFLWKRNTLPGSLLALFSLGLLADWNLLKYNLDDGLYYGQLGGCVGSLAVTNSVLLVASLIGTINVFLRWRGRA